MKILYTSYIGFGNLGDDLCLEVFRQEAESAGATVIASKPAPLGSNQLVHIENELEKADTVVIGGGSLLTYEYYLTMAIIAEKMGKPVHFWGTGLDGMSLGTARALANGEKIGRLELGQVKVELLKSAVDAASSVFVRGPVTKDALCALHPALIRTKVVGDPAFLVDPAEEVPLRIFSSPKPVIAVNWGEIDDEASGYGGGGPETPKRFFAALEALSRWFSFLFFPMIGRDVAIHKKWAGRLGAKTDVKVIGRTPNEALLAGWLKMCHLVIGRKLHAQALAAAASTPFIAMGYRSKCYDFAASLDMPEVVVPTGSPTLTEDVLNMVNDILTKREIIHAALADYRRVYRRKLKKATRRIVA